MEFADMPGRKKSLFEQMIGVKLPCDYAWDDKGIVRVGARRDIAAYAAVGHNNFQFMMGYDRYVAKIADFCA